MDLLNPVFLASLFVFIGTLVRSAVGFGDTMIALPLLVLLFPLDFAVPLLAIFSSLISMIVVAIHCREVRFKNAIHFIIACAITLYPGMLLSKSDYEIPMKIGLGVVIAGFALFKLVYKGTVELRSDRLLYPFGIVGGILGGAFGMNGPPVVIFGSLRKWDPNAFRATLQGIFLFTGPMILMAHGIGGNITPGVLKQVGWSLPGVLAAVALGLYIGQRWSMAKFHRYVYMVLVLTGVMQISFALKESMA